MRWARMITSAAAALGATLALCAPAQAITFGRHDGTAHPNVGAMMAYDDPATPNTLHELCTVTLVAPRVVLTAAHCTSYLLDTLGITDVWVTFNTDSASGPYIHGVMHQDPLYPGPQSDPHDIAVIVLDQAPSPSLTPALLPSRGLLDRMKAAGTLGQSTSFTVVGYGVQARQHISGGGTPLFPFDGFRWVATAFFNALNPSWLRLTQNPAVGAGGGCYGDSGGPNFLGTSQVIAGTTIEGDTVCRSTNVVYRMDTDESQDFLAGFGVPIP